MEERKSILECMPETDRNALISLAHKLEYQEKSFLFRKGDRGNGFYIIVAGEVLISVSSAEGREIILNRLAAGEVFGEIAMFDQAARTADAIVTPGTKLIAVGRAQFFSFLDKKPALYGAVIELFCKRLRYCSTQVESFALADGLERLMAKLIHLAETEIRNKGVSVAISQSDLAKMLGLSREAVNKNLRELQALDMIVLEQKKIIIPNVEKLAMFQRSKDS